MSVSVSHSRVPARLLRRRQREAETSARSAQAREPVLSGQPMATVTELRPGAGKASTKRRLTSLIGSDAGLATAEYAIATLAAVGFAALLVAILSSGEIRGLLMSLISSALSFG